jgi:hypothetical protein
LGDAPVSSKNGGASDNIEGLPGDEELAIYGGSNPNDNSGYLQYVSIRFGGIEIAPGNEINGLTLGGVGNGTTIDHIEVPLPTPPRVNPLISFPGAISIPPNLIDTYCK